MIEVRIREDSQSDATYLCEWEVADLDRLIPTLGRWGGYGPGGEFDGTQMSGQIYFGSEGAFFEVIVNRD